ncbi:MAG: hypothetical protein OEW15_12295 [Nitrospirota bacterium]|nr:hypothetical protein [Nitrospirota bacterium]
MPDLMQMIGKEVEIIANGMSYRGTLIEVTESEVNVKTLLQWLSLPASSVSSIKLAEKRSTAVADKLTVTIDGADEMDAAEGTVEAEIVEDAEEIEIIDDFEEVDEPGK